MVSDNLKKSELILERIEREKVFAIIRSESPQKAVTAAKAVIKGGMNMIEIAMSSLDKAEAISEIKKEKNALVAANSVITSEQTLKAIEAGADLIISPIIEMRNVKLCRSRNIPIILGASSISEAYEAWKLGSGIIKIFPTVSYGGADFIKRLLEPMPFLKLMATGGITEGNFIDYIKAGASAVGIGRDFYENQDEPELITKKAERIIQKLKDSNF